MTERRARALFDVAPSNYVDERSRLAKLARAAGDKQGARELLALKRPTLAMWAIVAAGADVDAIGELVRATEELAMAQGTGDRAATIETTRRRKSALETVVAGAVAALGAWEPSAEARRAEIRTMVDQLSRHPGLEQAWIDGTLRELPDADGFGFAAFTGMEVRDRPVAPPRERRLHSVPDLAPDVTPDTGEGEGEGEGAREAARAERAERLARERAERQARAARAVAAREARRAVAAATKDVSAAQRKVDAAEESLRAATEVLRAAEDERDAASQRQAEATDRLARLTDLDEPTGLTLVDGDPQ